MKLRTIFLVGLYALIVLAVIPVLFICMILGAREPLLRIGKWAMGISRAVLGLRVDVSGLAHADPPGASVFMANHVSFLDGPLLFWLIPRPPLVILKKGVFRIPVVGLGMKYVGFVPVDRKGQSGGRASVEMAARTMKERGWSFLIFPEGTRSRDGRFQALRRGGFFLAQTAGAPIIPVSIRGTFEIMPKGRPYPKKGSIRVMFHPPVPVAGRAPETMAELMEEVRSRIASGLAEERL